MQWIVEFFKRHATTLFFPMALILYDFAAYLSTDLIQPGIINVVREFDADVSLAPAASVYLAGGMALQWLLGPLSDRIGRRPVLVTGALIFSLACTATLFTASADQFLVARGAGTSICFIATVGYVTVQGVRTNESHQADGNHHLYRAGSADHWPAFRCGADALRPLEGAVRHYCGNGFYRLYGPVAGDAETVQRGAVPFSAISVVRDFRDVFRNRVFLFGVATISLSYIPMMSWVAVSPGDPDRRGWHDVLPVRLVQVPVFGAVIVANMVVARFVKDPTSRALSCGAHSAQRPVCTDRREPAPGLTCGCGRCWAPVCMRLALG